MSAQRPQQPTGGFFTNVIRKVLRLVLCKSDPAYLTELTGGSEKYWDRMIAAQQRATQQGSGPPR
jgi:hypothetical protein